MIPTSVPVFIEEVKGTEHKRYSEAKLRVFYVGETADHRLFTESFAKKIIQTLPSTPVVGYYSEEDEDFIGHNSTQYVYGHVPETATIYFETDEETQATWLVTSVYLYTERNDNIGEVAKKIIGKQHSLELNPKTLKYKVNRDNGKFRNFEFVDGEFIGLSILGDNERPAFTGSGFFTTDKNFEEFSKKCHQNFDKFLEFLNTNGGQIEVFNSEDFFKDTGEFLARTVQEDQEAIYSALQRMGLRGYIVENTKDYAVVQQYLDGSVKNCKYDVLWDEEGNASLSNPRDVRARYLTDEELDSIVEHSTPSVQATETSTTVTEVVGVLAENTVGININDNGNGSDDFAAQTDTQQGQDDEDDNDEQDKPRTDDDDDNDDDEDDEVGQATASVSSSALSDSERAELDGFRKAKKVNLINSYKDDLVEEIINSYLDQVDSFSYEELEAKLAIEFRKAAKTVRAEETNSGVAVNTFNIITPAEDYNEHDPAAVVKKYKNR